MRGGQKYRARVPNGMQMNGVLEGDDGFGVVVLGFWGCLVFFFRKRAGGG